MSLSSGRDDENTSVVSDKKSDIYLIKEQHIRICAYRHRYICIWVSLSYVCIGLSWSSGRDDENKSFVSHF